MRFVDVIARKRDGQALTQGEVEFFVSGVTKGDLPDYQVSALLMAIVLRGMTAEETSWLTAAMVRSGDRVDLSDLPGIKVGKHSTGGVGDKVSIILAPVAAACGVMVPKMSGRGLGHTGGTLDKLESIPGYRVNLSIDEFKAVLRAVGTSIIGQTSSLVPADKKLYALRDVTATVVSVPLIASSVMSKKLAEGSNAVLLDVKCGDGAFMKTRTDARALAQAMVDIGKHSGIATEAFVTSMNTPLGRSVGNAIEIIECIETLKGAGSPELRSIVATFASRMVRLAGVDADDQAAAARVDDAIKSGKALDKLARMIERHGGNPRVIDDYRLMPAAPDRSQVSADRAGFVTELAAEAIGHAAHVLGAGRSKVGEPVDHGVGAVVLVRPGDQVQAGQPLVDLHHRAGRGLHDATRLVQQAITIGDAPRPADPLILEHVQ
jgi:pyrimidine-nucleoside phosphorylase